MSYPILYKSNETDFFTMGLGPIEMLKATVTQERNGIFIFEGEILTDNPLFPLVLENYIIKADADHLLKDQRFRIKRIVPNHDGKAQIYAEHVSYLSRELTIKPEVNITGSAQIALNQWKSSIVESNPFVVSSDITTSASTKWRIDKVSNPMMALGGVEGSILDRWGGEYLFDNYHISLLKKRGKTATNILAYGRNITDFEQERNILSTYTSIAPYAIYTDDNEKEVIVTVDGFVVDSEHVNKFPNRVTKPIDFSSEFGSDEIPTKARLTTLAQQYIADNEIGVPTTSIKISFLDLSQTADYAEYAFLEQVNLCDDVRVHYPKLGVNTIAKVVRVVWNVLTESYDEIEIGQKRMSLASQIQEQNKAIQEINTQVNQSQVSADGKNMIFYGLYGENGLGEPNAIKIGDSWFKPNGLETELYVWTGIEWKLIMSTSDTTKNAREIEATMEEVEEAKRQAKSDAEQALVDAKAHADAEVERIEAELTTEIGGAIDLAEQAKADAVTKANQALEDAKAHADAEVQASKEHFDSLIEDVESDVADAQATANSAVEQIDTAVANAGFASLDDTLQNMNNITMTAEQNAQQAITDASNAYEEAQTSISEAQTAQANSLTALGKADNALDGVSSLNVRVDDVEAELELKADNAFMNEDGTLTTLSNAITFNANRFSSDMSRIESRVESLAGEINLVILRDAFENTRLLGGEVYPNATANVESDTMSDMINVVVGEELALSKNTVGGDNTWRISFYDNSHNYVTRVTTSTNQYILTVPVGATKMWVSYPTGSQPQMVRGSDFIPYRPNLADQMTSEEVNIFRNQYDEFADKTERRLTAIDSSDGRLETAELLITQTADGLALKADQTTVDELTGEVESLGTEFDIVAGQVSSKVWKSDIDGIEIGGRNYVLKSEIVTDRFADASWTDAYMYLSDGIRGLVGEFELGFDVTLDAGIVGDRNIDFTLQLKGGGLKTFTIFPYKVIALTPGVATHLSSKFTGDFTSFTSNGGRIAVKFGGAPDGLLHVKKLYIKKGNKATDWTPAPEDTDAKFDNIETEWTQTFESFEQTITGEGGINTQLQTLDSTMSSIVDPVTGRLSIVEQTASGLQTTVADKANQSQVTQLSDLLSSTVEDMEDNTSQISQLADNINLRVEKDDVINQINVSTEGILIDGKKTHITGTTTIDDGVIKNAHISNLNADKINAGTINTERLNTTEIVTKGLTTNVIKSTHLETSTATIDKLFANDAMINTLTAKTAFIDSIKAVEIDAGKITSGTISTARLDAKEIITEGLVADVIEAKYIKADTALFDNLFTSTLATDRLSAQTAWITNGMFANASIDGAKIADATIGSAKIISLDASKITAETLSAITTNTGDLYVSGDLTMATDNTFIKGTFDYGDPYDGAHNPRYFANGQMMIGRQNIQYEASVHAVNPDNSIGAWKYFGNAYFGPDTVKLRNLKSPNGEVNATTSIYGGEIVVASDYEGIDNGVTISSASGGRITALGGATIGAGIDPSIYSDSFQINGSYRNNIAKMHLSNDYTGASFNWANNQGFADLFIGKDSNPVIWSNSVYDRTYSESANMVINTDGSFGRASSASRYKLNISEIENLDQLAYNLLTVEPKRWNDKRETEAIVHEMSTGEDKVRDSLHLRQYHGLIAEDLRAAGLDPYISYNNKTGAIDGIEYDKLWTLLLPIIKKHQEDILELQLKMGVA